MQAPDLTQKSTDRQELAVKGGQNQSFEGRLGGGWGSAYFLLFTSPMMTQMKRKDAIASPKKACSGNTVKQCMCK